MIARIIDIIENLDFDAVPVLASLYEDDATFVHPIKTVKGSAAIGRQWKMTLKYCPGTKMKVTQATQLESNKFLLLWIHSFDAGSVNGTTTLQLNVTNTKILHQVDEFDVEQLYSYFRP